ncbi:hypothetical protein [Kitasatospora sp. NPDC058046]|uniref:hypothetical protein n=1 Tax=Kitasatospora sp. NPDC058046 TaxID=3346312 RepID=UPI0036DABBE6
MPRRTTFATLTGIGVGITLTLTATTNLPDDHEIASILQIAGERFFPAALITFAALVAIKRWVSQHDEQTRTRFASLLDQRRAFEELYQRRQLDLDARESLINRAAEITHLRQTDGLRKLNEANAQLDTERAARRELQRDFDELAAEYNTLVCQTMQEHADRFSRPHRTITPGSAPAPVSLLQTACPPALAGQPPDQQAAAHGDAG